MNMTRQQLSVHAALLATLPLLGSIAVAAELPGAAEPKAVQSTNFSLGLLASDSDTKGSTSNGTLGLGGIATLPIGSTFGAALAGGFSRSTARTSDALLDVTSPTSTRPTCRFNSSDAEATLFARRPTLGKIAASYGSGRLSGDCGDESAFISTGDDELSTDYYRLGVEAYLGDFTLGAVHTSTELESGPKLESDSFSAAWYPLGSLRVSLSGGDLYGQDTYGIEVEHQPEFMGDGLSVLLGYSSVDRDQEVRSINFAVVYHFGTKVELKTRDRQYR
jgi:hypothetical protein